MAYISPIHKPSSVRHAVRSNFLNPDEDNLIVAKANRAGASLDDDDDDDDGDNPTTLTLGTTFTVYGQITLLLTLRPEGSPTDHLFVATDKYDYFTVSWDRERQTIRNERAARDMSDRFLRSAKYGAMYIADPRGRMLGLHIYQGIFTVIPLVGSGGGEGSSVTAGDMCDPAPIRLHELNVKDIVFLDTAEKDPIVALLYEDGRDQVHLRIYRVKVGIKRGGTTVRDAELEEVELPKFDSTKKLDPYSRFIIPLSEEIGGVVVLGEQTYTHVPFGKEKCYKQPLAEPTVFSAWGKVDEFRYLLGDDYGRLYLMSVDLQKEKQERDGKLVTLMVEFVGKISTPSRIVYLKDDYVFIGSHLGDSQLIRLTWDPLSLQVVQTFPNLAPILDFRILDMGYSGSRSGNGDDYVQQQQQQLYSSGQTRIVSGSGAFHDGTLRSLRSGVRLEELGILGEMSGVRGLWGLKTDAGSEYHDILLVSFISESRLFRFHSDGDVEELDSFGNFSLSEPALTAANVANGHFLHVTTSSATLMDAKTGTAIAVYRPPANAKINLASANEEFLVLAAAGTDVVLFDLRQHMKEIAKRTFVHEVSALAVPAAPSKIVLMGSWTTAVVSVLAIPGLETLLEEDVVSGTEVAGGGAVPRSLFLGKILEGQLPTLMVAMGDGRLLTYAFSEGENEFSLSQKKNIVLGVQPVYLQPIPASDGGELVHVFATCDHPSLVYGAEGSRIVYSAVTVRGSEKATFVTPFHTRQFPGSVVVATDDGTVKIMEIDPLRTTHIQTLHVGDTVRRIAHARQHRVFVVVTIELKADGTPDGRERYPSWVRIVDEDRFEVVDSWALDEGEFVEAVVVARLENGGVQGGWEEKVVVGTGFHDEDESGEEPTRGRIIVFEIGEERKLKIACVEEVAGGGCKCLDPQPHLLLAATQKHVRVYHYHHPISPSTPVLSLLTSHRTQSSPIDISVYNSTVAIGDMMRGATLLRYNHSTKKLVELARNYSTMWVSAISLIGPATVVVADAEGNLVLQQYEGGEVGESGEGVLEEDKRKLRIIGEFRLGEMVNRIRRIPSALPPPPPGKKPAMAVAAQGGRGIISPEQILQPTAYLATVDGGIYLLSLLTSQEHTDMLLELQSMLARHVKSPGDLGWGRFRAYASTERWGDEAWRVVDGEFVERVVDAGTAGERAGSEGGGGERRWGAEEVRAVVEGVGRVH
ncbi:mono-functional DNA-alkylating methyl methanesulfonate N-term-domain-containing protein [Kalaharituber pfeilii]|nr:mono-functional DNA-alkylating methyl methanesulfonate N-term-domain-containing protein [Kalaharituber pfeilii]